MKPPLLSVTIKKPEQTVFDGFAKAISSISDQGKLDILSFHANFIAIVKESITIHQPEKEPFVIPITIGVMKVKGNLVKIILGIDAQTQKNLLTPEFIS